MSTNRIKKSTTLNVIETADEADHILGEIATFKTELQAVEAEMNKAIVSIREAHEQRINTINGKLKDRTDILCAYAEDHRDLFQKRKSMDLTHGTIGFRMGTPKLKTLKGWTWDRVLENLRSMGRSYIRTSEEPNKEMLLADREALGADGMKALGVLVVQDETFFVEPKMEALENA